MRSNAPPRRNTATCAPFSNCSASRYWLGTVNWPLSVNCVVVKNSTGSDSEDIIYSQFPLWLRLPMSCSCDTKKSLITSTRIAATTPTRIASLVAKKTISYPHSHSMLDATHYIHDE